ncbi:MAG: DMT family transporter [Alphaproteobacteria bacterium]|nr:DMT family transporter [Alphaproteobacteria bacterium]
MSAPAAGGPAEMTQHRPLQGILWIILAVALLSAMDGIAKWVLESFSVPQMIAIRSVLVLALIGFEYRGRFRSAVATQRPWAHAGRTLIIVASVYAFFEAMRFLPLATLVAISFGAPLFMTALSVPMLGERVGLHRWAAIVVGFGGVLVITRPDAADTFSPAALLVILASALYATAMVLMRKLVRTESEAALMFWQNCGVLVVNAALAPFLWKPWSWSAFAAILAMAALVWVSQRLTVRAFRLAPVGTVAPFHYTELVWATLIGWAVWNELPGEHVWFGAAIVVASGLYVVWRERRDRAAA